MSDPLKNSAERSGQAVLVPGYKERKLFIGQRLSKRQIGTFVLCRYGTFIQEDVLDRERFVTQAREDINDLTFVVTTSSAYHEDIVGLLGHYLKLRAYTKELREVFVSVAQELVTNAVLHGNMALDINLDILEEDRISEVQNIFTDIHERLNRPDTGNLPLVIKLTCHDESVILDITDCGTGFDFNSFVNKYDGVGLRKGMDLVSIMARDVEYDNETRTISVILEEPVRDRGEQKPMDERDIAIGVIARQGRAYNIFKKLLIRNGFSSIKRFDLDGVSTSIESGEQDVLMFSSDFDFDALEKVLKEIRSGYSPFDLPVLIQKPASRSEELLCQVGEYVNDFISSDVQPGELIARIKAHYSMSRIQKEYSSFCKYYQSEIRQSSRTIKHLETVDPLIVAGDEDTKSFVCVIKGSETLTEAIHNSGWGNTQTPLPYGHGFTFHLGGRPYILFMSMNSGLSSVLVLSYVKGYIEQIKDQSVIYTPKSIIEDLGAYVSKILPPSFDFKVMALSWCKRESSFEMAHSGAFMMMEYDKKSDRVELFDGRKKHPEKDGNVSDIYKPAAEKIMLIFDACINIGVPNIEKVLTDKFSDPARCSDDLPETVVVEDPLSGLDEKIPYCFITHCPEKSAWM